MVPCFCPSLDCWECHHAAFLIWLQAPAGFAFVLACPTLLHSCADATKEPAVSSGQLSEQNMLTEPDVAP